LGEHAGGHRQQQRRAKNFVMQSHTVNS
jgi:hypothetical protein